MAIRQYTAAQLLALRESPLVAKPDNLPAIEQWIEYVYLESGDGGREKLRIPHSESAQGGREQSTTQQQKRQQQQRPGIASAGGIGGEGSPMGSFSTGRPTLGTRTSTLRGNGEEVSLGPPKTMFPSSRNVSRLSDLQDRNASSSADATPGDEPESARSRFFSDRQLNRRSMNNEKEGRDGKDNRDSWTNARERRDRHDREDGGDRRNGFGERHEGRWGRDERRNGDRAGGWREREQQRRDRENDRAEKEPEWMDDPVVKQDQELGFGMAKTQEEFQKWKESMNKKARGETEPEEPVEAPAAAPPPQPAPEPKPAVAPLKLDGFEGGLFGGGWGAANATAGSQGATTPGGSGTVKSSTGKPKTSRFASMFKPAAEEPPPPPVEEPQPSNGHATKITTAEDQEGFNRVLQMLGSAKLGGPAPPTEQTPASPPPPVKTSGMNGAASGKPKSRFTDMFAQKSPERLQSPQQGGVQLGDSLFSNNEQEASSVLGTARMQERPLHEQQQQHHMPRSQEPESAMSPGPSGIPFNALREQQPRPASGRVNEIMFDPPSRGAASPDINIQNLLAQQRQRPHHASNESQQLLNLLRKDTSRPPSQQAIPHNGGIDQAQLQHWLESQQRPQMPTEPHAPKPRVPQQPPGLFEEQLMRNYAGDHQRQEPPMPMPEPQRRPSQRVPPGFFDEQSIFLQQQQQQQMRRQFAEGPPPPQQIPGGRRPSGHPNLPQMQIPQGQQFPPPSDFHITSPASAQGPPPPGFNPHMPRHPPGFHNINIFQQQQREPPPPGFGGLQSPPANAPPGFFPPQGIPPGFQQMRSPTDGMPPGRGRGFDGFDPSISMGPRR